MNIQNFEELIERTKKLCKPVSIAVVCAQEEHIFAALQRAGTDVPLRAILLGDPEKLEALEAQYPLKGIAVEIEAAATPQEAARKGVALVAQGHAGVLMKGTLQTAELLREVVDREHGIGLGRVMSHIALAQLPGGRLLAVTDGGMLLHPALEEKKALIQNAVELYHALGEACPRVAVLAAAETVNPKVPASVEAQELARWQRTGGISGCLIEGPLSYDLAVDPRSARQKGYQGGAAGCADILVTPDLISGNLLGKALVFSAGARMAGLVLGARAPIVVTSRGSGEDEKYLSILLAAAAAAGK